MFVITNFVNMAGWVEWLSADEIANELIIDVDSDDDDLQSEVDIELFEGVDDNVSVLMW